MSRKPTGGFRRRPRVADKMTPDLYACVDRALAAERAGDIEAALEWHQSVPMFRRGRNRWILDQLARLEGELPPWVWARWIAYQAMRCEDGATGRLTRASGLEVAEEFHYELLEDCYDREGDPVKVLARVLGESWAYHQRATHDGGGLLAFVDEFAVERLAEHADLARRWAAAPMGGYELGESRPGTRLRVRKAAGGDWVEVLDLGARSCVPRRWALGRLVPSGVGDLPMFDMPPMEVPRQVAEEVALGPDEWWDIVIDANDGGILDADSFLREDYQLTTDVLDLELLRFGTRPPDLGRVMQELREGHDEVSPAAYRVLARAHRGDVAPSDQAYVAAAVLNARAYQDTRRDVVRSGETAGWAEWADRVVEPARSRLLRLAGARRSAA